MYRLGRVIKNFDDIKGNIYKYLTVQEYLYSEPNKHGVGNNHYYKCICKCGKEVITKRRSLLKNEIKSCGCYTNIAIKEAGFKKRIPDTIDKFLNNLYRRHKNQASYRNYSFTIDREFHKQLVLDKCHYCGRKPYNTLKEKWLLGELKYNGIDRKYNHIGYDKDNLVTCCIFCNKAKNTMNYEEFKKYIKMLIDFNK